MRRVLAALVEAYQAKLARWLRLAFVVVWAWAIWTASSASSTGLPSGGVFSYLSNAAHVVIFGVLSALTFLSIRGDSPRRFLISLIFSMLYGVVDEWHQSHVPGRVMDPWDLGSDTVGAAFAGCLLWWVVDADPRPRRWLLPLSLLAAVTVIFATL